MAVELKTDSSYRYMMYRSDASGLMPFASRQEKQDAIDAGKKYTAAAYADVWARDSDLVGRVRQFLGENFHWHDRLANSGSDIEVVQTLMDMVRGGSVVVIPEDPPRGGSVGGDTPIAAATTSRSFVDLAMDCMGLSREAAVQYADDYNDLVDRYYATMDKIATPLGDAQPFEYTPDVPDGDSFDIAKTPNTGEPGTWYTNPGSGQMRLFGDDGGPVVDLDFDHFHNGLKPHAHNWNGGARDGGDDVVPFSPWNP